MSMSGWLNDFCYMILLVILLFIDNPIIALRMDFRPEILSEKYVCTPESKNIYHTYRYKDPKIEPKVIHMGMSIQYVPSSIGYDSKMAAIPEIRSIDVKQLLRGNFSEKQQKKCLESLDNFSNKKIIREQDVVHSEVMKERKLKKKVFDSDIILRDVYSPDNINRVLKHPIVQARFERLEKHFKHKRSKAFRRSKINKYNRIISIIDALKSGKMERLIDDVHHADFATACRAFNELKSLFFWNGTYICHDVYPVNVLGVDILRIVADDFMTRADFIMNTIGAESLNEIEQFSELCNSLQCKNDVASLEYLYNRLAVKVTNNEIRNMTDEICLVIAERALRDPINLKLGQVKYGSWDAACAALHDLEQQVGPIEQSARIIPDNEYVRKSLMHRSKVHRLAIAQKLQKDRSDYKLPPNTESKVNSEAGAITKSINVPKTQEALKEFFVPMDVRNRTADILNNSKDYPTVADGLERIARQVFGNAHLCKLEYVADMQESIDQSLDKIRAPKNDVEFVFHVATVDHVLTDLQTQSEVVVEGKPTLWERTPGLLARAVTKFILRLNPVEQVKDWGSLAYSGLSLLGDGIVALEDAALHPVTTAEKIAYGTEKACEFVINTARFTSDTVSGIYYLTPEERSQRMSDYWQKAEAFYKVIEPHLTAENIVDVAATIAADVVFLNGVSAVGTFFKEIDAIGKISHEAKIIAQGFKSAIEEHPAFATAEGLVLKMSDGIEDASRTIKTAYNLIIDTKICSNLKSIGENVWQSPAGLIYKPDKKFGNRINHVLAHAKPNPTKNCHTIFNVPESEILKLIDEAWLTKGEPLKSDLGVYIVDMKKSIGLNGESAIRIVTIPGTSEILTAYPVKL